MTQRDSAPCWRARILPAPSAAFLTLSTALLALSAALLIGLWSPALWAGHGQSMDGELRYGADFVGFDYTSPNARVGGSVALHAIGGFDKMNPFTLKGSSPDLLETLVFESLATASQDEPFSQYGLLAEDIAVAEDGLSVTYTLREAARFSDGSPVTADDALFSFETLKSEAAHPFYRAYWRDIVRGEVLSERVIRFHFARQNRELAMITGELPVFSRAYFTEHPFEESALEPPLGSGPYRVGAVDPGRTITYERNPDYWGWELPARRGMFNFEQVRIKYFKDPVVALEAFKAGEFDFIFVNNSKQWARDFTGGRFDSGEIIREELPHQNGAGMQGFVFNLRRPALQDIRVRKALSLAFDFEWSNANLFHGQYTRSESFFSNSELAASGPPSAAELALLEPFRDQLDPVVFQTPEPAPSTAPPGSLRQNLRQAARLLREAGWRMGPDQVLVNAAGERMALEMVLASPAFERVLTPYAANLKRLGVELSYRTVDLALYQRRIEQFDYDMIVGVFSQSQSPGNEQLNYWHSSSANESGSRNLIGVADPVIDALVEKIIYVENRQELITACRALDRVLRSRHYLVPHFHTPFHRISYWNRFERPAEHPLYYGALQWFFSWWLKDGG